MSESVFVTIGGEQISVSIEGGNMAAGASVAFGDLNQAVSDAEQAAADAATSAAQASTAGALAGAAAGASTGASAGSAAGTTSGATAGTAAANVVVAGKADVSLGNVTALTGRNSLSAAARDGSDVSATSFRTAIGALPLSGSGATVSLPGNVPYKASGASTVARTLQARLEDAIYLADYASGTPNSAALQAAINDAQSAGKDLYLTPTLTIDAAVTITAPINIIGVGKKTSCAATAATFNWITIQSSDVSIKNIYIDNNLRVGGWDFTIDTGSGLTRERIQISNVTTFHSKGGLRDIGTGLTVTVDLNNYFNRILKGPHIAFTRSFAYLDITNSTADFNGSGASGNFTAFSMTGTGLPAGAGGGKFKSCNVLGEGDSALTTQIAFLFTDYKAAWFVGDVTADSMGGDGYVFRRCNKLEGTIVTSLCQGHGVTFEDSSFVGLLINGQGRKGVAGAAASKDLIRMTAVSGGNTSINLVLGYLADPTGNHVNIIGNQAGSINLLGGIATGATGRALITTGTSGVIQWTDFVWSNNTAGNYSMGAATHYAAGVFASGGRTAFAGPGSA